MQRREPIGYEYYMVAGILIGDPRNKTSDFRFGHGRGRELTLEGIHLLKLERKGETADVWSMRGNELR